MTRKRRFGRIKQAIKNGATGGYLTKYLSYQSGATTITITKVVNRNGSVKKAVDAFGNAGAATELLITSLTGRAVAAQAGFGVTDTVLGLAAVSASSVRNRGFLPAKAVVSDRSSGTAAKLSEITGLSYKKPTTSDTYTYPFGQVGTDNEFQRQSTIAAAVTGTSTGTAIRSVSFKPERMYA